MHRPSPLSVAVVTLCAGLAITSSGPGYAGTTHRATRSTTYAFQGSGFGTRVTGGQVPAGSSTTGYQHLSCTNQAGLDRTNDVADATVPGLGKLSGVKTRVWTTSAHGVAASHARHTIGKLTLASGGLGSLSLDAIRSDAKAYRDASGFHSTATTSLGGITLTPPIGPPQTFPAPTPNQPITIPGLATIYLGTQSTSHGVNGASANGMALRIDVVASGSSFKVGRSHAEINGGMTVGIFKGHSNATRVTQALTNIAHSGPNPLSLMPCAGTNGALRSKALADVNIGGQIVVTGASSSQKSSQGNGKAHGFERSKIAKLDLGGGALVVNAVVGKANVTRTSDGWVRNDKGTRLGSITAGGQAQTFPPSGVIEIPGVAKLERDVVNRSATGIKVVALRVTLLDGSGAVINLGEAQLQIRRMPH